MMFSEIFAVSMLLGAAQDAAAASARNPVAMIEGEWAVVDEAGRSAEGCAKAQIFKATPDGRYIDLTERGNSSWSARYLVVHREKDRMLLFIEDEDRRTEQGDPVLWWANFDGPDHFKWRRYDWDAAGATAATWQRCGASSAPTASASAPARRAIMPEGLASVINDVDYPAEAIRDGAEGTTSFTLDIDSTGKPARCSILRSSGSPLLDTTTCRIMMERARFQPARDARGKPVPDQITSRITWRLPDEEMPPRMDAAFKLWTSCVLGEAAKHVPGEASSDNVARRSFPPCSALEALVAKEMDASVPLVEPREGLTRTIEQGLAELRTLLETPDDVAPPDDEAPPARP